MTLSDEDEDDASVRTIDNGSDASDMIEILGDLWSKQIVTQDVDLVDKIFQQFQQKGIVSRDLLS